MRRFIFFGLLITSSCTISAQDAIDNSACVIQVENHSSIDTEWLLKNPEIHFVYWGTYWQTSNQSFPVSEYFNTCWSELMTNSLVLQRLAEYGVGPGTFDQNQYYNYPELDNIIYLYNNSNVIDDSVIVPEINKEIQYQAVPYPNNNTLYVIFLPQNVNTISLAQQGYGGYHNYNSYNGQNYSYAIITYFSDQEKTDGLISHEITEATTDPNFQEYYSSSDGSEIADLCENDGDYSLETVNNCVIQKVWSQRLCLCF